MPIGNFSSISGSKKGKGRQQKAKASTSSTRTSASNNEDRNEELFLLGRKALSRTVLPYQNSDRVLIPAFEALRDEIKAYFRGRIEGILDLILEQLQILCYNIRLFNTNDSFQRVATIAVLTQILKLFYLDKERLTPTELQCDAIFTSVFGFKDVIVIKRTRGGKSLIFYTFILMTSLIVVQITLLNRLGEEQAEDIRRALRLLEKDSRLLINIVNLTAENRKLDKELVYKVRNRQVQYIFLSLELTNDLEMREVLKEIADSVGIVVIDEVGNTNAVLQYILIYRRSVILSRNRVLTSVKNIAS